ncbi:MAG: FadR family transcriptional regulator [Desulfobacter sp.]|nr:MAG: FadR family transcriptional regulator [Desulfobacter sp.]
MTISIKPIKPKRISDQVFDQIREWIYRGKLKPGEKLLTERELAQAMGVSRTTIRDAVQRLAAMGLIIQKQGQGTFVKPMEGPMSGPIARAMETQDASLEELLEVRMGLECNSAALAARRADEADISALEQSIIEMEEAADSGHLGAEADTAFHMALAYAAKNSLNILIMKNFYDYLFHGIKESRIGLYETPGNIEEIIKQHKNILDAIKERDPSRAFSVMKKHIEFLMEFVKGRA